ncbi:helix-turn-helix domain-containing protein [Abyssalbus ytuae]|uniref:Helix-turn-helix domain-containing protein n=1 Tax=Abyssalbus ytuae TaxID=2926907 RepID=A0A9E7A099_9FLAO|nr:helix-turn-helix domain-containing protein [Abyssalbus ytuae]UOB18472.1 helix-turn-helix domain-containing protein [Abyssalbus ytuae]
MRNVAVKSKIILKKDIIHFAPFIYVLFSYLPHYFLSSSEKMEIHEKQSVSDLIFIFPHMELIIVILMVYYTIYIYMDYIKGFEGPPHLKVWLKVMCLGFFGVVFSYIIYYSLLYTGVLKKEYDYFITTVMSFFIAIISFFAFNKPEIFDGKAMNKLLPFIKYKKTGLSDSISHELKEKLLTLMVEEKPYLNSDFKLMDVADLLNINRHHASQVINQHFELNFFDFVNHYRIEKAIELLEEDNDLNITEIAYESGFNNTVSFNKAFKKISGTTPSNYKKKVSSL